MPSNEVEANKRIIFLLKSKEMVERRGVPCKICEQTESSLASHTPSLVSSKVMVRGIEIDGMSQGQCCNLCKM
jgi:hypothetical protein